MTSDRLTSKRVVSAAVAVPALALLLAVTRTWLSGRSTDPLLGGGAVTATGSQLVPGVVALALVALVALVTTLTGGAVVRRVSAVVLLLAALGAFALMLGPLRDPEAALGRVAASGLGRTGLVRTTAELSVWVWVALVADALLVAAAALAVVAAGRWGGLSRRFEAPVDPAPAADDPPAATRSAWDDLSEGRDPTLPAAGPTRPGSASTGDDPRPT